MILYLSVGVLLLSSHFTMSGSLNRKVSSSPTSPAPSGARFALLARYILPPNCEQCADDVENVIHFCFPYVLVDPECMGALTYAARSCRLCLCDVLDQELPPDLDEQICPFCPELAVCTN